MIEEQNIEKLSHAESFHLWKFEISIYMKAHGLKEVTTSDGSDSSKNIIDEVKDAKAQKLILQTIDKKLKYHIMNCKTASEMFEKLCNIFEGSESRNKSKLLQEFFNYKCDKQKQTITQIITNIENLAMRLNNLGHKIENDLIISKILTCLPETYRYFATAWESTPNNEKTLTNLTNRLLLEETRNSNCEEQIAFKVVSKEKCFKCNKVEHFQSQCKMCTTCKKNNHEEKDCRYKNINKYCKICKKTNHSEYNCYFRNKNNNKENKNIAFLTNENNINKNNNEYEDKLFLAKEKGTSLEWHRRLGHPRKEVLDMLPNIADGIKLQGKGKLEEQCEICIKAKQSRLPFNTERMKAERILQILHTDICGPFETLTHDGNRYFMTILDDYSHLTKTTLIKHKSEAAEVLRNFIEEVERDKKEKVSCIRCDNGGEYRSSDFKSWCSKKGIKLDYTIPYTPQLNGKAERLNRTILEKIRALLFDSNLKDDMWGEAVYCATYLLNRLPSQTLNNRTPYEFWNGRRPNLSNIQVFGSIAYAKQLEPIRKLDSRSNKLIMIGYANNGYRLWNQETRRVEIHRDIIFNNEKEEEITSNDNEIKIITLPEEETNSKGEENINGENSRQEEEIEIPSFNIQDNNVIPENDITNNQESLNRIKRTRKVPEKLSDYVLLTYTEATNGKEKENWEKAIDSEKDSLNRNNTWKLVDKEEAQGKKILSNKWVFRVKEDGTYKARLVVRGFEQKDIDFNDIYSPVVSQSVLNSLFALTASKNFEMMTFDVKTAFLYGELDNDIYMYIPDGYFKEPNKICKLNKSLYGLKQAPITWNRVFTQTMLKLGLTPTKTDRCVFINANKNIIIAVYVDDGIAIAASKQELEYILGCLEKEFQIKIFREPKTFVGLEIHKDETGIILKQRTYIENLLKNFYMIDAKPTSVPCNNGKETLTDITLQTSFPYRECIGALLYLSTRTRPDIAQAVNKASRKIENPNQTDVIAVKKILKYLAGTKDKGIKYVRGGDITILNSYCDADYANDPTTRRSTTGFVIMLSDGPISWCSKRQPIVALSSTEAEYIAAADCCKETLYLKSLLSELINCEVKITLNIDNQSSIQLIKTGSFSKRSKHIDVRYYFIHEQFVKGNIIVKYCSSDQQVADILTKPLGKIKFEFHCNKLLK